MASPKEQSRSQPDSKPSSKANKEAETARSMVDVAIDLPGSEISGMISIMNADYKNSSDQTAK